MPGMTHSEPEMKRTFLGAALLIACVSLLSFAQSSEFSEPWKDPTIALAVDPFEGNKIDWDQLATDKRVVAIIHRATIGDRADRKFAERRDEAKRRGYKWGGYHVGKPGDPVKQADFFLETAKPTADDLIALDLESVEEKGYMNLDEARVFIERVREKTGRYPLVYANNSVTSAITGQYSADEVFGKTRLWYARFKRTITDFPKGTWGTYTLWQFSSEQNCRPHNRSVCLYTVPGTEYDMDIDVYHGTVEDLKRAWPLDRLRP
jgi:GH25 family lysozyme M1 (1,4-beta-N-acetylmuramidase)